MLHIPLIYISRLGWPDNTRKIATIFQQVIEMAQNKNPAVKIVGFSTNVSNYSPFRGNGAAPEIGGNVVNENGILKVPFFNSC